MPSVVDVAGYILNKYGDTTTMKLQKLTFYAQAAYLAETGEPLLQEDFQAWQNGPVCPELFSKHRKMFIIRRGALDRNGEDPADSLTHRQKEIVDGVVSELSRFSGNYLSKKTHSEDPWRQARDNLLPTDFCRTVIPKKDILEYYKNHPVLQTC